MVGLKGVTKMPDKKLTDTQNLTIRKCGGTWEYCNGYCSECTRNNYYVSTKTECEKYE